MELLFDFDGTIANTFEVVVRALGNRVTPQEVEVFRDEGLWAMMKKMRMSKLKLIRLGIGARRRMKKEMSGVVMFAGIADVLVELKQKGITMGILSSNSKKNVDLFLTSHKIDHYFDYVLSCRIFWAKKKFIKKILIKRKLDASELVYVGDEVGDVAACHENGVKMVGVSWGWNSKSALKRAGVDWIVETPREILTKLNVDL